VGTHSDEARPGVERTQQAHRQPKAERGALWVAKEHVEATDDWLAYLRQKNDPEDAETVEAVAEHNAEARAEYDALQRRVSAEVLAEHEADEDE
jgi:hypothetical protein